MIHRAILFTAAATLAVGTVALAGILTTPADTATATPPIGNRQVNTPILPQYLHFEPTTANPSDSVKPIVNLDSGPDDSEFMERQRAFRDYFFQKDATPASTVSTHAITVVQSNAITVPVEGIGAAAKPAQDPVDATPDFRNPTPAAFQAFIPWHEDEIDWSMPLTIGISVAVPVAALLVLWGIHKRRYPNTL